VTAPRLRFASSALHRSSIASWSVGQASLDAVGWSGTTPALLHAFGFSGHGLQLAPGVGAVVADLIVTGISRTPIDAFSISRFAGDVIPDEKLWSEFDPELVATFRQMRGEAGHA
jgi:hypothetical protein